MPADFSDNQTLSKSLKTLSSASDPAQAATNNFWSVLSLRVYQIIAPVTICSLYSLLLVELIVSNRDQQGVNADHIWTRLGFPALDDEVDAGKVILGNLIIVTLALSLIILVTLIILFLFYMNWYRCLNYYFYLPSLIVMALISPLIYAELAKSLNFYAIDYITLAILVFNFTSLGVICIFNVCLATPLVLQQAYLIHNSSILAVTIVLVLPAWTSWMLLGFLVIWDLFAVLAPCGPLNMIINMAEDKGVVDMPGLVYSTQATTEPSSRSDSHSSGSLKSSKSNHSNLSTQAMARSDQNFSERSSGKHSYDYLVNLEERGLHMGLGDFIFYSLLVALTARTGKPNHHYATLAALDAIIMGVTMTIIVLAIFKRALPALPISIALGILITVPSLYLCAPLANSLSSSQIFI